MSLEDIVSVSGTPKPEAAPSVAVEKAEKEQASASETEESQDESTDESDTSEEADGSQDEATEDEGEPDEKSEDKPKRKGGVQKKIDKLTRRLSEKDQLIAQYEARLKAGAEPVKPVEKQENAKQAQSPGEPHPDDFDTVTDYIKAVSRFEREQERKVEQAENEKKQAKESYDKNMSAHHQRIAEFKKSHADFGELYEDFMVDVGDINLPPEMESALIESDLGPAMVYELLKDRTELNRILSLRGNALVRAMGRMEAKVEAKASAPKAETKKTAAPPPINPVGRVGKSTSSKSPEDMSIEEYMVWRRKNG